MAAISSKQAAFVSNGTFTPAKQAVTKRATLQVLRAVT